MKKVLLLLLPLAFALAGCDKYDDSKVWDELNAQKAKLAALEGTVSTMNSNIGSLQSLVSAVQDKVTVNSVTKEENGYLITFSDGNKARIENGANGQDGKDGVDGKTPQIGAKADADGKYFWTLNGSWMLDSSGNKVPTSDTPQVKIEDNQWMVSYDGGNSWSKVDGQTSMAGSLFESVTTDADNAVFTLNDGTVITIPLTSKVQKLQLIFDETVFAKMRSSELLSTAYTITAPEGAKTDIETFESDGWTVTIRPNDEKSGRISIKSPETVTSSKILFLLTDDLGDSFVKIINIGFNETEKPAVQTEYSIDHNGGELIIPLVSSTAELSEGADWLTIASVGDQVVLNVTSNESYDWRTAQLTLEDGTVVSVTQITADAMILSKEVIEIDGRRQLVAFPINTNVTVKAYVTEGEDWLTVTPSTRGLVEKIFTFTAKRNTTDAERTAVIEFHGNDLTGTCKVIQAVYDGDPSVDVTEAAASDEGEELELRTSLIITGTTDGYVVGDAGSYVFVQDASHAPTWQGDSVKFNAVSTRFNDMPALGSVQGYTTTSEKNTVKVSATDITSRIDTYASGVPTVVKITGDLTSGDSGSYNLSIKGATKKVLVYKPADFVGLSGFTGHNVDLTGIYYGESDGVITVIAISATSNGLSLNEGDQVTVAEFISLAKTDMKLKLVGTVSGYNQSNCRFDITDNTGSIYVYTVTNKSEWASKIKNGGTVELLGKYQFYEAKSQHEVVDAEIISFTGSSSSNNYKYQKVGTITSGKSYIIAAPDGDKAYVGLPITADFGYINVDEATETDGVIMMPSRDREYVITEVDGGYTITQSDGRILYQTGTFNSFNVSTTPPDGDVWDIAFDSDGVATITNTSVTKYIQYSITHSSYGSYASAQSSALMPCIYEYVGEGEGPGGGDEPGGDEPGGGSEVDGNVETLDFSKQGFESGVQYKTVEGASMTVTFGDGGNDGKYYTTGEGIRIYSNGYVKIEATKTITKIVYTFASTKGHSPAEDYTVNTGSFTPGTTSTWTGSSKEVVVTRDNVGSGHWRLQKVEVTYTE